MHLTWRNAHTVALSFLLILLQTSGHDVLSWSRSTSSGRITRVLEGAFVLRGKAVHQCPQWREVRKHSGRIWRGRPEWLPHARGHQFPCSGLTAERAALEVRNSTRCIGASRLNVKYAAAAAAAKSLQSYPTLCDPRDGSPPGSPVPGILQARTLEWVAISVSNAWKWKVKGKSLSRVRLLATPWTAAFQAPPSMGFSRQEYWSGLPLPSPECEVYSGTILNYSVWSQSKEPLKVPGQRICTRRKKWLSYKINGKSMM